MWRKTKKTIHSYTLPTRKTTLGLKKENALSCNRKKYVKKKYHQILKHFSLDDYGCKRNDVWSVIIIHDTLGIAQDGQEICV